MNAIEYMNKTRICKIGNKEIVMLYPEDKTYELEMINGLKREFPGLSIFLGVKNNMRVDGFTEENRYKKIQELHSEMNGNNINNS